MSGRARIRAIRFDCREFPARAEIITRDGVVHVEWLEIAGARCWSSSGAWNAKREAVPAIERIEKMCESVR